MGIEWDGKNAFSGLWYGHTPGKELHVDVCNWTGQGTWGIEMWSRDGRPLGIEDDERYTQRYDTEYEAKVVAEQLMVKALEGYAQ